MSEEKIDYRAELERRHDIAADMTFVPEDQGACNVFVDIMVCDVMISKEILGEMGCRAEITKLAKECLGAAKVAYPHYEKKELIYNGLEMMLDCLFEHPRLTVKILTFMKRMVEENDGAFGDLEWINEELEYYTQNIALADAGRLDEIRGKEGMHLEHDPIEWTARWEEVIDEVDEKVEAEMVAENMPRGMGYCYGFWHARYKYLAEYGIQWRSPSMMNPDVMFD